MSLTCRLRKACFWLALLLFFIEAPESSFSSDQIVNEPTRQVSINAPADLALTDAGSLYIWEVRGEQITSIDLNSGYIQQRLSFRDVHNPIGSLKAIAHVPGAGLFISTAQIPLAQLGPSGRIKVLIRSGTQQIADTTALAPLGPGKILIADGLGDRVLLWDSSTNRLSLIAGIGKAGYSGDGGPAKLAKLRYPTGVAALPNGDILISDSGNCRLRLVDHITSTIHTIAGTGACTLSGDGGAAVQADLNPPGNIAIDNAGNIYVVEGGGNRVRRIAPTGIITTFAGDGKRESTGDGGPADKAGLAEPSGIAIDADGNVYIAEYVGNRVRRVDASSGIITTIAGNGLPHRADPIL